MASGSEIAARLEGTGAAGVFLRFVLQLTGRADLFVLHPRGVGGGGLPAGVHVAAEHWVFADDAEAAEGLVAPVLAEGTRLRSVYLAVPEGAEPIPVPAGWRRGTDVVLAGAGEPEDHADVLHGPDVLAALDRVHPELADRFPPPPILARLPFRFHALQHGGQIVAMCDTTVDDGGYAAIQQVHTVEALRRRGFASALVRATLGFLARAERQAVWVCDEANVASLRTATACGLRVERRVPLLLRG